MSLLPAAGGAATETMPRVDRRAVARTRRGGPSEGKRLTVFYDGGCPLCRREIGYYRRLRGAERIEWLDVSTAEEQCFGPGLCRDAALARFHVRLPDGRLECGARGFAELWAALPGWRRLGRIARSPRLAPLLELGYRGFLLVRPVMQRLAGGARANDDAWPQWLERDLRSDHAGETGAVAIYRGVLAVSRDAGLRGFAERHVATEQRHLATLEALLATTRKSALLPLWRLAGFLTGALPALFGARAVYATIDAVESFVDRHYAAQIRALDGEPRWRQLRELLQACREDELGHRDEARRRAGRAPGVVTRWWIAMVGVGSALGVMVARRM